MVSSKPIKRDDVSKSWFCVFNNPEQHGYEGTPAEIVSNIIATWIIDNPQRSCAVTYCISSDGLKHIHAVFEDVTAMRFSKIKKLFPSMHIEATKGNKDQAEQYINKQGKYAEIGEQIIYSDRHGEIKGRQGQRRDLDIIEEFLLQGMSPDEIMDMSLGYRRYEKFVRDAYYRKRMKDTPIKREVKVYWHWGESGSGKSHTYVELSEERGESNIYYVDEYTHAFDKYNGEPILMLDELRTQIRYERLLSMLGGYKSQVHARYTNVYALWNEVHITTVYPPELLYKELVPDLRQTESISQLFRRITNVIYHYKDENGEYKKHDMPISSYSSSYLQKELAHPTLIPLPDSIKTPFSSI